MPNQTKDKRNEIRGKKEKQKSKRRWWRKIAYARSDPSGLKIYLFTAAFDQTVWSIKMFKTCLSFLPLISVF